MDELYDLKSLFQSKWFWLFQPETQNLVFWALTDQTVFNIFLYLGLNLVSRVPHAVLACI